MDIPGAIKSIFDFIKSERDPEKRRLRKIEKLTKEIDKIRGRMERIPRDSDDKEKTYKNAVDRGAFASRILKLRKQRDKFKI